MLDFGLAIQYLQRRHASELRRSRKGVSTGEPRCLHFHHRVLSPVMLDEDTWMAPNMIALAAAYSRLDVAWDTGLYNYYDQKFGDYAAAVAELIRP